MGRDDPKPTTTRKDWGAVSPVLNHWKKQKKCITFTYFPKILDKCNLLQTNLFTNLKSCVNNV